MFRLSRAALCWALVGAMALSPSMIYAQQLSLLTSARAKGADEPALSYVTPATTLFAVAHPRRVLTAPGMEMLPIEVISAAGKKELGIDPLDVERILAIVEAPALGRPPQMGVVVRFSKSYDASEILEPLVKRTVEAQLDGKPYRRGRGLMDFSIYMPNGRVLMIVHDDLLRRMLANQKSPTEGPMSRLLAETNTSQDFLRCSPSSRYGTWPPRRSRKRPCRHPLRRS